MTLAGIGALTLLFIIAGAITDPYVRMHMFMGSWMLVFAGFKIMRPHDFAYAFSEYDPIAARTLLYGYVYPYIELLLGICYILGILLVPAYLITVGIMSITAYGVVRSLSNPRPLVCACMGALFKLPLTVVSLMENVLMIAMALFMLYHVRWF